MRERAPVDWAEISAVEAAVRGGDEPVKIRGECDGRRVWREGPSARIAGGKYHRGGKSVHEERIVPLFHGVARYSPYLLQHPSITAHATPSYRDLDDGVIKAGYVDDHAVASDYSLSFFEIGRPVKISGQGTGQIDAVSERVEEKEREHR